LTKPEASQWPESTHLPRQFSTRSDTRDQEAGFGSEMDRHLERDHSAERGATDEARSTGVDAPCQSPGVCAERLRVMRLDPAGNDHARKRGALEPEQAVVCGHAG
jgi:hypothetical protein